MKRLVNIVIILLGIVFTYIIVSGVINFNCYFKTLFGIRCPGCGLTRSFRAILNFDFGLAFNYNILGIPLFIILIIITISLIVDTIYNRNKTIEYIFEFFRKYYIIILLFIIVTTIINNVHGI